jgi:hypothetical protein
MADVTKQTAIEKQIQDKLAQDGQDIEGAQELIDAHIDDVTGGGFSLHVQFGNQQGPKPQ